MSQGNCLLAVCSAFYLAWWTLFFCPAVPKPRGALYGVGVACIVIAALAGILGMARAWSAAGEALAGTFWVPGVVIGAVALYVALALVTGRLWHRPVTTELVLFVAWLALELCVGAASGRLGSGAAPAVVVVAVIVFALCLGCYLAYYHLAPMASFVCGAVPLAAVGIASAAFGAIMGAV